MIAAPLAPLACPTCKGPVDVKTRHVAVAGAAVRLYCSTDCLRGIVASSAVAEPIVRASRRRSRWWIVGASAIALSLPIAYVAQLRENLADNDETTVDVPPPAAPATPEIELVAAPAAPVLEAVAQREQDKELLDQLASDAWIHPLAGPTRRMPVNHNGAFGAERGGERPPECVSGHCGVDVGRTWGEPVHAVHEGVVDLVQRTSNDDRGGLFVRIAHRNGTLFSWYFHLAAIPRSVVPGTAVRAGHVIGLLGDTGIKHSEPHLHFALSVRTSKQARDRYLDPEPLIAIWPLWIPTDGADGHASTASEPGVPVRGPGRRRQKAIDAEPVAADPPVQEPAATAAQTP